MKLSEKLQSWVNQSTKIPLSIVEIFVKEAQELEAMTQWQLIETCPKNTPVLVFAYGTVQNVIVEIDDDGYWADAIEHDLWEEFNPTHWMPLPKPPQKD